MWIEYENIKYTESLKKSVDYINIKNALICGILLGLKMVSYIDIKAKNKSLTQKGNQYLSLMIPLLCCFGTLSFWDYLDKRLIIGSILSDTVLMIIEIKIVNEAIMPFWLFNLRYPMHILDIIYLSCIYHSLKNLRGDINKNSHKYLEGEDENKK